MSISGDYFIFDGIPSDQFGLMFYTFDKKSTEESDLGTNVEIVEDRIGRRSDSIHYGITDNKPLTFSITFGGSEHLDRYDVDMISTWLTGHAQYKMLEIFQADMSFARYRCMLNNLKTINHRDMAIAFTCDVVCDSQFGYTYPIDHPYTVTNQNEIRFNNRSSYNGYFYPYLIINPAAGATEISIVNKTDGNRLFQLKDIPAIKDLRILIDNKNQIITSNGDVNLYQNFNNTFLRLVRGVNVLNVLGSCNLTLRCEFLSRLGG